MTNKFNFDLQKIYDFITFQRDETNKLYKYLENNEFGKLNIIDNFAKHLDLELNNDLRVALISRLVSLKSDSFTQVLKKYKKDDNQIEKLQELAYQFVSRYWLDIHQQTLEFINSNNLLTPFYRAIFQGVYEVGVAMTSWQSVWTDKIINTVNKDLLKRFNNDENKIMNFLEQNNLFDLGYDGQIADRSYSVLVKQDDSYISQPYITVFKKEVTNVIDKLEDFANILIELEDDIYSAKWDYILYIQALIEAFGNDKTNTLILKWAKVDEAWMKIKTPIQIGHPLEYYEDHFRHAVALEWDIRLSSPTLQNNNRVKNIKKMFDKIYNEIDKENKYIDIYNFSLKSLQKVQLYLGRPALFFGAEFNGLFSAQVVPNDEVVSAKYGKKIFAFSDEILQLQRAKPFLKLSHNILGQEFLTKDRKVLFQDTTKWQQIYDITTIGHEYGHILWCDDTTEMIMNNSGNYKNIEEFKATCGGLVSFFINEENNCIDEVLTDTIKRAVGLISWMEVDEVQPYYCEGLIHLSGLFETGILNWDKQNQKLLIKTTNFEALKQWYINTYKSLAKHYLNKLDATIWLKQYMVKKEKYFMPIDEDILNFVQYYFAQYKIIGQELDTIDKKDNYYTSN